MAQNSSASGKAQLDALVAFISTSVADVAAAYESASVPLPSLDPVALDDAEVGKQLDDGTEKNVARAVRVIEAACAQLIATLARPGRYVLNVCYDLTELVKCTVDCFPNSTLGTSQRASAVRSLRILLHVRIELTITFHTV